MRSAAASLHAVVERDEAAERKREFEADRQAQARAALHIAGGKGLEQALQVVWRNANAGIVVGIDPKQDFPDGPLAGVALQERLESLAYEFGGSDYCAPGQLVGDFVRGVPSTAFGEIEPSYKPGVRLGDLSPSLPDYAIEAIREALPAFGKQIRGFDRHDAVLTGVETRTSSPVRITRDDDTLQSLNVRGLYPCGEGAGYAGGILSAGVDGIKVAEAVAKAMFESRRSSPLPVSGEVDASAAGEGQRERS